MRKCVEVLKKIWGSSGESLEIAEKISRNLVKTLRNCDETFKKLRRNLWENLWKFWWKFIEILENVSGSCGENLKKYFRKFSTMFRKFKRKCAEVAEEIPKN